jgi:hypothetical protein
MQMYMDDELLVGLIAVLYIFMSIFTKIGFMNAIIQSLDECIRQARNSFFTFQLWHQSINRDLCNLFLSIS